MRTWAHGRRRRRARSPTPATRRCAARRRTARSSRSCTWSRCTCCASTSTWRCPVPVPGEKPASPRSAAGMRPARCWSSSATPCSTGTSRAASGGSPRTPRRRSSTRSTATDRPGGAGLAALLAAGHGHDVALVTALADDAGGRPAQRAAHRGRRRGVRAAAARRHPGEGPAARRRPGAAAPGPRRRQPQPPGEPPQAALRRAARRRRRSWSATTAAAWPGSRGCARPWQQAEAPVVWDPHPDGPPPVPGVRLATPNLAEVAQAHRRRRRRVGADRRPARRAAAAAALAGRRGRGDPAARTARSSATPARPRWSSRRRPRPSGDTCGAGDRFAADRRAGPGRRRAGLRGGAGGGRRGHRPTSRPAGSTAALRRRSRPRTRPDRDGRRRVDRRGPRPRRHGGRHRRLLRPAAHRPPGHPAGRPQARRLPGRLPELRRVGVRGSRARTGRSPPQADRSRLLAALDCVDAVVVFDEPTPEAVLTWLRPDVWVKGGDYADGGPDLPEAELVRRWGGADA